MPSRPGPIWPRPLLLDAYNKAIDEGCCYLNNLGGEARAKSFIASFYRLRRRSDSEIRASWIRPEFDLVTAMYQPNTDRILLVFNSLPDDMPGLPALASVPEAERVATRPELRPSEPKVGPKPAPALVADDDLGDDVMSAINRLVEQSNQKK